MLLLLLTPGAVAWAGSNDVSSNRTSLSLQTNNVKTEGVVVDAKGEPLIGVSILEQGTTNGTITDIDGVFSLQVSPNAVLEISYIGYKTQKLAVKPNLGQIVMHEDTEVLEEVVVTALGIKRSEKALSYNVQQVKGDELTTYNPQIQISAESETKRSIFREKDKTKRSKKESAQHSKSRNKSFVMTSVSAL